MPTAERHNPSNPTPCSYDLQTHVLISHVLNTNQNIWVLHLLNLNVKSPPLILLACLLDPLLLD